MQGLKASTIWQQLVHFVCMPCSESSFHEAYDHTAFETKGSNVKRGGGPGCGWGERGVYLRPGSSFSAGKRVLVQLEGLLLLVQLVQAVLLEELEVLQLGHLGQAGATRPAVTDKHTHHVSTKACQQSPTSSCDRRTARSEHCTLHQDASVQMLTAHASWIAPTGKETTSTELAQRAMQHMNSHLRLCRLPCMAAEAVHYYI